MRRHKNKTFSDFFNTVKKDLRETDIKQSIVRDLGDVYDFYITPKERKDLLEMGWFRRWIYRIFWFFKSIFLKLTAFRRFLFLVSVILLVAYNSGQKWIFAYFVLFVILLLELKDKLLARDELRAGRAVQAALMPDENPTLPGWDIYLFTRSANEVGGDLVDYIEYDKKSYGLMVGDVAGKGLGAALLMAQLQASVQALASHIDSLPRLVGQLNIIHCGKELSKTFISFIFLKIQSDSNNIEFVNAGHIPPLIFSKNSLKEWHKGSAALGLNCGTIYKTENIQCQKDDVIIVYTDGVTEARNDSGIFFGEQRLFNLSPAFRNLSSEKIGKHIINSVDKFAGKGPKSDDLTLMVLRRTE